MSLIPDSDLVITNPIQQTSEKSKLTQFHERVSEFILKVFL
jgi:hypothetical protein